MEHDNVLWRGVVGTSPSLRQMQSFLAPSLSEETLAQLTVQIIRNGDSKTIPTVLNTLCCNYWRVDGELDPQNIYSLKDANSRTVCGLLFKKGLVVWTCRQCAKDPTCVQCDECFRNSNHDGHEVYFHRASGGGGCCDCGDPEAWTESGNCCNHGTKNNKAESDPLSVIPPELYRGLIAVLKGVVGLIVSYTVSTVRGYHAWSANKYVDTSVWPREVLTIRLHNDDVHTYDDVTTAIRNIGFTGDRATEMTVAVDREGHSVIRLGLAETILPAWTRLSVEAGLLCSVIPDKIFSRDGNITAVLSWLSSLGTSNDGMKRAIVEGLLQEMTVGSFPPFCTVAPEHTNLTASNVFNDIDQFPSVVPLVPETVQGLDDTDMQRIRHPFNYCHRNCLSVLMLATPFLTKSVKKIFNDMVVLFQHDSLFKLAFSQFLTLLYPSLNALYCRSVGTSEDSLFNTSVQVFTADSVVRMMSSNGISTRPFAEQEPIFITKMLTTTILASLYDFGCVPGRADDSFLTLPAVNHRRMWHVCRDLEYVTESFANVVRTLSGQIDPGALEDWLKLTSTLQLLDRFSRRHGTHVEHDDDIRWQVAANLILDFESVSTSFVGATLCPIIVKMQTQENLELLPLRSLAASNLLIKSFVVLSEWASSNFSGDKLTGASKFAKIIDKEYILPYETQFEVSVMPVSIHIPLHRFISKVLLFAAAGNVEVDMDHCLPSLSVMGLTALLDYPVRCLVLVAQVQLGMWRRNGSVVVNLVYNYSRVPLCKSLRDADLVAVQTTLLKLKPDDVLALMIRRFEVCPLLMPESGTMTGCPHRDYLGSLLGELLRLLAVLMSHVPYTISEETKTSVTSPLAREIAHLILGGASKLGSLQVVKTLVGREDSVSDDEIRAVVDQLCVRKEGPDGEPAQLEPRPAAFELFDLEFPHLSQQQLQVSIEAFRSRRIKEEEEEKCKDARGNKIVRPVISASAVPTAASYFLSVRRLLYCPLFLSLLERSLRLSLYSEPDKVLGQGVALRIACRCIHLLTILLHCHESMLLLPQSAEDNAGIHQFFNVAFQPNGIAYGLLVALVDAWTAGLVSADSLYQEGFEWVLRQFCSKSADAKAFCLTRKLDLVVDVDVVAEVDLKTDLRRKEAQRRAKEAMARQALKFKEQMLEEDDGGEEMDAVTSDHPLYRHQSFEDSFSDCIFCHERTGEPVGYLACLQPSCVISSSLQLSPDCPELRNVYRVVAVAGCPVVNTPSRTASVICRIPLGEHVLTGSREGKWVQLKGKDGMEIGWSPLYDTGAKNREGTGAASDTSDNDLSSGGLTVNLHPVSALTFRKHGEARVHVSRCGHGMHFSCYDGFYASSLSSALASRHNIAVDALKGEMLCPLCKGLTNALLPYTPKHLSSRSFHVRPEDKPVTSQSVPPSASVMSPLRNDSWTSLSSYLDLLSRRDVPPVPVDYHQQDTERDITNHANVSAHALTFAELCLSQYHLPFRKKMVLDLTPPCRPLLVIRAIHSLWSCLSYTTLSAVRVRLWAESERAGGESGGSTGSAEEKDLALAFNLLMSARCAPDWLGADYAENILSPLLQMLSGDRDQIEIDLSTTEVVSGDAELVTTGCSLISMASCGKLQFYRILSTLPTRVIGVPTFPSPKRTISTLNVGRNKGVPIRALWPVLRQPLLAQDLNVIAVAVVSCFPTILACREVLGVLAIARLAQILLEPASNGSLPTAKLATDETSLRVVENATRRPSFAPMIHQLEALRDEICLRCGVFCSPSAATGSHLLEIVIDSLTPFLLFLSMLNKVLLRVVVPAGAVATDTSVSDGSASGELYKEHVEEDGTGGLQGLLLGIGLPPLAELLQSKAVADSIGKWANHFRDQTTETTPLVQSSTAVGSWIPQTAPIATLAVASDVEADSMKIEDGDNDEELLARQGIDASDAQGEGELLSAMAMDDGGLEVTPNTLQDTTGAPEFEDMELFEQQLEQLQEAFGVDSEIPAELSAMLSGLQSAALSQSLARSSAGGVASWRLIGLDPLNSHIDEHRSDLLGKKGSRMAFMHSVTPLVGSLCGTKTIYGLNCAPLKNGFADMSHLGLGLRHTRTALLPLPSLYTDLYQRFKFPPELAGAAVDEPALCLSCGRILCAGNRASASRVSSEAGECTLHSRVCGMGTGVFFLVQMCRCLLIRGSRSCYFPSLYVDRDGEVEDSRRHNRPLFLSSKRYRRLQEMYLKHQIAIEVVRRRTTEESVIRENWY